MESFDLFCVGSIPTFLSLLGNERAGVPLCSLYHSDPLTFRHISLSKEGGLRNRLVCWCVKGIVLRLGVGSFFKGGA